MNMLAAMSWGQWFLGFVLMSTCLLLILVILLQRGRGGGLAGAFGGAGGSSAFGAKTGDVFTWITVVVATVFVLLSIVTNFAYDESGDVVPPSAGVEVVPTTTPTSPTTPPAPSGPDGATPVTIDLSKDGNLITPTGNDGETIKIERIDGPPPEIQKMLEEEQKKNQGQAAPGAAVPAPAPAAPAPTPAEEKKPEGAATP